MKKIRVLQVNKLYYPAIGGVERTLRQICEGLGNTVLIKVLVCQKKGRECVEKVNGVEVHRASSFGTVASMPISIQFFKKYFMMSKNADIVHVHLPFPLADIACILFVCKGNILIHWHSDVVKQKKLLLLYHPVMHCFLRKAKCIVVGAPGIAAGSKYLTPYLHKCRIVPFAVDDRILNSGEAYLEKNGYERKNNQCITFLFVGRLVYYKGVSVLLKAFRELPQACRLIIIGDGPLKQELLSESIKLALKDRVVFLGNVPDDVITSNYKAADVLVLPSVERSEAFGLVQLEAMAFGLPVINTNIPSGVPEVSIHNKTGLTVEAGNVKEMKNAMKQLIEEPENRIKMGKAARQRVESNFTNRNMLKKLNEIYEELSR